MALLIMQFFPASFYCNPFGFKYSPQHPVLKYPRIFLNTVVYVLPLMKETKFHIDKRQNYNFLHFNVQRVGQKTKYSKLNSRKHSPNLICS
jgi:hypothetical protein